MKANRIICSLLLIILVSAGFQPASADTGLQLNAHAAIVIDAEDGEEIFAKNADTIMYPASTTKIMTALLAVELGELDELVTVGNEVNLIAWDSSRAHLQVGDELSLRDLVYGMMLASGNDAAYSIAVHIARTHEGDSSLSPQRAIKVFCKLMNERAKEIGANSTNFVNPDGYPHASHYTTARDLALIMAHAMKYEDFRQFDSTASYTTDSLVGSTGRSWRNGNYLIRSDSEFYYSKAVGGKTGYTVPAGFTMVATAAQGSLELVAVALKTDADGRWLDTTRLLEFGFLTHVQKPEVSSFSQPEESEKAEDEEVDATEAAHGEDKTNGTSAAVMSLLQRFLLWLKLI